jgi:integrase
MEPLADSHHLFRRNGIWYFKRRVPEYAFSMIGAKVIQRSLKTSDIKEARKLRNLLDVRYDAQFDVPVVQSPVIVLPDEVKPVMTRADVEKQISEYIRARFARFELGYMNEPAVDNTELEELIIDRTREAQSFEDRDDPDVHSAISRVFGLIFPETQFDGLTEAGVAELVRRGLSALAKNKANFIGGRVVSWDSHPSPDKTSAVTFGIAATDYLNHEITKATANGRKVQWIEKVKAHVEFLIEFVGHELPVADVNYDVVLDLQSSLSKMPANRTKHYPNLSIAKAIERAAQDGKPLLKPLSQSRYLDFFRGILNLAFVKRIITNNPAMDIRPLMEEKLAASDKRRPFTSSQLAEFFNSAFYRKWPIEGVNTYSALDRDWRFWLPLLAAFTGMRPGEICQLETTDVLCSASGIWYLHVAPTDDDDQDKDGPKKSIKTEFSRRSFPVHPKLIDVGFLDFLSKQKSVGADGRLFPSLKRGRNGYYSDYPCRRFREAFLPEGMTVEPRQTFYSFRHSFRDALRRADAPNDVLSALGGWSEGTKVSDNYGDKNDPDYLFKYIEKLHYPNVTLNFRYT